MYPLFESIKIVDGLAQHLDWHQRRLDEAYFTFFGAKNLFRLKQVIKVPEKFSRDIVKCRFRYNQSSYFIEYENYLPRKIVRLKIVISDDIEYSLKYQNRSKLEKLLESKGKCDDILIAKNGCITDTSYSNIVFFNGERWLTPRHPLLKGTCRDRLLYEGSIFESEISIKDIERFESFKLINAMLDFYSGDELPVENILL